jgi:hypothetical protein
MTDIFLQFPLPQQAMFDARKSMQTDPRSVLAVKPSWPACNAGPGTALRGLAAAPDLTISARIRIHVQAREAICGSI